MTTERIAPVPAATPASWNACQRHGYSPAEVSTTPPPRSRNRLRLPALAARQRASTSAGGRAAKPATPSAVPCLDSSKVRDPASAGVTLLAVGRATSLRTAVDDSAAALGADPGPRWSWWRWPVWPSQI